MSENAFQILDTAFRLALWTFGGLMLVIVVRAAIRYRLRRVQLRKAGKASGEEGALPATPEEVASVWRALLVSAVVSLLVFVGLAVSPISPIENFANSDSWKETPLRLTEVRMQRFEKGFSLEGEVWNQTDEAMDSVAAFVRIWDEDKTVADEVEADLKPLPIDPRSPARWSLRYERESPFNIGYDVVFRGPDGLEIPTAKGFDVVR